MRDCGRSCADCGLGALARQIFFSSGPKLPFKPLKPLKRFDTCQWFCHTSGFWTLQTLHGRFRRSKTSHLLDCGLWALCETVGGVAQPVGSGLWRAKSFFSSGPKLPFKPLKPLKRFDTCQWFCHTSGFWTLQTLHGRFRRSKTSHLLDCGLWALCETVGGVAQTVGSGLWRAKSFFSSGPKLPFKPLKPLKRFDTCQWFCHTSGFWTLQTLHGRFRRSKTSHLLDCGLLALCETVGGVAQTVGSGLCGPKLPFKPLKPLNPLKRFDTCQWFCHTSGFWTFQTLHGRFRRSKTSHLLDCGLLALCETVGGVAQTVGSGLCGPKLPFKPLKPLKRFDTCQWFCHTSGFWTLQTLHGRFRRSKTSHLLDCGLWALCETVGGVAQPVGSGLWRAKSFFSSGPKPPFKPLKPLKRFDTCQWFCHTSGFWTLQTLHGRFRRSKTSHLLDCGLLALCETVGGVAQTVGSGLCGPKLPFKPLKPLKRFDTCQWFCHTSGFSCQLWR